MLSNHTFENCRFLSSVNRTLSFSPIGPAFFEHSAIPSLNAAQIHPKSPLVKHAYHTAPTSWRLLHPAFHPRSVFLVPLRAVNRSAAWWVLEHTACVFAVVSLHVHCISLLVLVKELLLEIPIVRSSANGELEILFGDRVPVLRVKSAKNTLLTHMLSLQRTL